MAQSFERNDGAVTTAPTAAAVATDRFPPKPDAFRIHPGRKYLMNSPGLGPDSDRSAGSDRRPTQIEVAFAENHAWVRCIRRLGMKYNVSAWGEDPPYGLEEIWELLASSRFLIMEVQRGNQEQGAIGTAKFYDQMGERMLDRALLPAIDPNHEALFNSEGKPIRFAESLVPLPKVKVADGGVILFPYGDDEGSSGIYIGGSIEEFQKLHGRISQTQGIDVPVTRVTP